MSRLRQLRVPLVGGVDDRVAAAVLPDGALSDLRNGRFNKAGELALRTGWRTVDPTATSGADLTFRDLYSYRESLVGLVQGSDGMLKLAAYVNPASSAPWVVGPNTLSPLKDVRRVGGVPSDPRFINRCSAALTSAATYGAVLTESVSGTAVRVFRVATDETVVYSSLLSGASKVVNLGTRFGIIRNTGSALVLTFSDPAAADPTFGGSVTLVTAAVTAFDAVTAVVTTPAALYVSWVVAGAVSFGAFSTSTGAQIGSTKTVSASGQAYVALASDDSAVHAVFQGTPGNALQVLTFAAASPYTTSAGPTSLFSAADMVPAWFACATGPSAGSRLLVVAQDADAMTATDAKVHTASVTAAHSITAGARHGEMLAGGVVYYGTSSAAPGAYTVSRDNAVLVHGVLTTPQVWLVVHGEGNDVYDGAGAADPPYAPAQAPDGTTIFIGRNIDRNPVIRLARYAPTERRQGCVFNADLHVVGGTLARWAGVATSEHALLAPVIMSATPSNGAGGLQNSGVYKYRAILRWSDSRQADFQGEVSVETEVTLGASDDTVDLYVTIPLSLARSVDLVASPSLEVYRTEAGPGELFYRTKTVSGLSNTDDQVNTTDLSSDPSLLSQPRLYTEGETGGTSGRLDNVLARPSSYVAATRDRLVLAGPDPEYQVSQLTLPSEPVLFTDPGVSGPTALVYYDQVTEDIKAVATLDDSIILGTAHQLFVSGGDGPNFAGEGEFQSPARLPSDVGFYDWRSVLETGEGLWFLGDADKLFLLPRGQSTPTWEGEAVRDRFDGAVVGAAVDSTALVAGWAVAGVSPTVVVRDLAMRLWSVDGLPFTPASLVGHQGHFWAVDSSGGVWQQSLTAYGDGASGATAVALRFVSGDVQSPVGGAPGLDGWGRVAEIGIEGTFQAAAALLVEVSYDRGLSWTSLGTHTVTGLSAGEAFVRQWYPARQRGGAFRFRVTMTPSVSTTEGCRLTGFSIGYVPRNGPSRLASAKRR